MPTDAPTESRYDALGPVLCGLLADGPARLEPFEAALRGASDVGQAWGDLVRAASHHGVLGVLDLRLVPGDRLPAHVRADAERRLAIEQLWHTHLLEGLRVALAILRSVGVEPCAMKGPALAARFYPTPASRHCLDLDLLVRPDEFDRAAAALSRAGYLSEAPVAASYLREHGHHLSFSRPGMAPVELHFRSYAGFGVELPASLLLDRAVASSVTEQLSILTPAPEDELIYLAVHAAGHSFIRLVWLYDLKLLLARHPVLDWDWIADRAIALGVRTPVAYTLQLLARWLGVDPPPMPPRLLRLGVRARIADRLLAEVSRPQARSARDNIGGLLFTSLLCDRVASGMWLVGHHATRAGRRRLKTAAPRFLPDRWSA